jgi:hypothetical protein
MPVTRYVVDRTCVTHDRLEDEVIIINVATGSYFSGSGPAADVWSLISQGASVAEAARKLASDYSGDEATVLRDIDRCVGTLVEKGLIQRDASAMPSVTELVLPPAVRKEWTAPDFDEYTDMWDLIKLDPIHETDEVGWPIARS